MPGSAAPARAGAATGPGPGRDGPVREGSVRNAAFRNGERVCWPDAPVLPGVTVQLRRAALPAVGVPCSVRPPAAAEEGAELAALLTAAWSHVPWEAL
ncbi:hypothetical protein [Kitasatospora phosalacinea]|uniref:Uncharacterized protein n=1 Tax=Kitasatospora phosalacinea TaxID=2065 RepID=A0A9W6PH43_9ACTN|nr:hypothetical protein [Kitasatospora phosalacinea]GLW56004.1 hypothetical protein Kpho01_40150 [Kitasatospora phosalacinea]